LPSETWMNIEAFKICLLCIAYVADNESSHQPFDFCDEEGHGSHAGMQICAIKSLALRETQIFNLHQLVEIFGTARAKLNDCH